MKSMFEELKELLKEFNPTLTLRDGKYSLVSDIVVLSQTQHRGKIILFGYVEELFGGHGWINMLNNEESMKEIKSIVESQIALRTNA